jgi:tetratricopeptide (TPR) repeat protein
LAIIQPHYKQPLITKHARLIVFALCLLGVSAFAQKTKPLTEEERAKFDFAYVSGNKEKILNNYDKALEYFSECYKLEPQNAALNYVMADAFYKQKKYLAAEQLCKDAIALDKTNPWYKDLLVEIYVVQKKNKDAAKLLWDIGHEKKEADYLFKASYLYSVIGDYNAALKALTEIEKYIGLSEEVVVRKEQIYLAQNKLPKAIKEVDRLIKAYPDNLKYQLMMADLLWANGKGEEAALLYQKILKNDPSNGYAAFALSDYYKLKNDYELWYAHLKIGMASADVESKAKVSVLSAFISGTEFQNQSERFEELAHIFAASAPGDPMPFLVLGDLFVQQLKYDSARIEYKKALSIEPATYMAWSQTVLCSVNLLNNDSLLLDCEEAISYFPAEPIFFTYGSIAAMQLKNYTKAIELANRGLEITTPDHEDIILQLNATLGDAYHYTKNYAASDSIYEALLKKDSSNAYAMNNYAYFLSLRKTNLNKAEKMSARSIELDPQNASYLDTYGWILYTMGNYTKAKEYIEKSLVLSPKNAEVVDHLGDVLYKLNDKPGAIEKWKKAKELGSDNIHLDKKINSGTLYE